MSGLKTLVETTLSEAKSTLTKLDEERTKVLGIIRELEPLVVADGVVENGHPKRRTYTKKGELEKVILACLRAWAPNAVSTKVVVDYVKANRPPSLKYKRIPQNLWHNRVVKALRRLCEERKVVEHRRGRLGIYWKIA